MPLLQRLFVLIKQLMFTLFTFSGQNFLTLFVRGKQSNVELRISKQEHHHMRIQDHLLINIIVTKGLVCSRRTFDM